MFWEIEKLAARIKELGPLRYREERSLLPLRAMEDAAGENGARPPEGWASWPAVGEGFRWKARDRYLWLCREIAVPEEWPEGREALVRFNFGRLTPLTEEGFESLLYVDGKPYQGVDANHEEIFLPAGPPGRRHLLQFRLWSGLEFGGRPEEQERELRLFSLCWLDPAADDLYYTATAALDAVRVLEERDPRRRELLTALDRAFRLLDWSRPGSEAFYASVREAAERLRTGVEAIAEGENSSVVVRAIGHTHIDVAWLWRLRHTREKAARSFSTVLRLMEKYPDYVFLQSMPQLYAYVREDYPDVYAQIRERVREGRWEAGGAMWLEADCNLPSGESLVRQIAAGTRFFRDEFGTECEYLWLPDVFGYCAQLPQILSKSGIRVMMTTKISWNQYNRIPHDTFLWRAPDGTDIVAHFMTTPMKEEESGDYYTYNGHLTPRTVDGAWRNYRDKDVNQELILAYGYGDGGGGVNRDMLELRRRLARMPGLPRVETGRADDYFRGLERRVRESDRYVHEWIGELYLEYHRGTYTSQAALKRENRRLELRLRRAEWLLSWLSCSGKAAATEEAAERIGSSWTILLRNQFHDILPGSCTAEVAVDAMAEYAEARGYLDHAEKLLLGGLVGSANDGAAAASGGGTPYILFNAAAWPNREPVLLPGNGPDGGRLAFRDAGGETLASQRTADGWLVVPPEVPAFGTAEFEAVVDASRTDERREDPFRYAEGSLDTPFYDIRWNEHGQLTRLYDKTFRREALLPGERGNVLQAFEDKPLQFDAWDIDIFYGEKRSEIRDLKGVRLEESGPVRAVVRFEWTYGDSVIAQRLIAYARGRRIDFATEIDWQESQQLLKAAFHVNVRAPEATYDMPFGPTKRPTHWNTSWDYARFESAGHQWADLSERGYGISLLNDCKYGYDVKDRTMRLSLIKSGIYPDPEADRGQHRFTYALLPHGGDWVEGETAPEAWRLNDPMLAVQGRRLGPPSPIAVEAPPTVQVDAVKPAEDGRGLIVRLHEYGGGQATVRLGYLDGVAACEETDLLERPLGAAAREGESFAIALAPHEIRTVRLIPQAKA
ncbi:alpha-mannosidase [Cohnella sp. GCM10027633]|uniref:alpha-mannosidase n=1 Tax=unclassified Cohnella TaxID=2636738 RepID=UPI003634873E